MKNIENPSVDIDAVSARFVEARKTHKGLTQYPGTIPDSLDIAYQIQAKSIQAWDDTIQGWKVGGIPPSLQETFQTDRLVGPIFERSIRYCKDDELVLMPVFEKGFAAIEAEYIIQLGDVSGLASSGLTQAQIESVIDKIYIGVEIASSPLTIINDIGPVGPISDFGNNGGLIVGPELKNWRDTDLSKYLVNVHINDHNMGTVSAPPQLKGPFGAVKFLIEHLKQHEFAIPVGTYVSTGAITGVHQAFVDDASTIVFDGLGTMHIKLIPTNG
jgi:2-keto-4-pentenoate hydratase